MTKNKIPKPTYRSDKDVWVLNVPKKLSTDTIPDNHGWNWLVICVFGNSSMDKREDKYYALLSLYKC